MSAQKSIVSGIAGRYAVALFELAEEQKALDSVAGDLDTLVKLLDGNADFRRMVASPLLSRAEQAKAMAAIAKKAELADLTAKFLGVLARNRRLNQLKRVIQDFRRLLRAHRGEVTADVATPMPLTDGQRQTLAKKLHQAIGRDVSFDEHVDPSLLGGLVVKVGSRMVDSSLKTKLNRLEIAMKGV